MYEQSTAKTTLAVKNTGRLDFRKTVSINVAATIEQLTKVGRPRRLNKLSR